MRRDRFVHRGLVTVACALACLGAGTSPLREHGQKLYTGDAKLTARMAAHAQPLPQEAVRCSNCHGLESGSASTPARDPTQSFGPTLGPTGLTRSVARRGGPPSRYDAASLCRLLRDGVDPAHVMIPQTMPRYTFTDAECEALWIFLSTP